ncbi:hypothetical protein IL252_04550 [Halomicrobium sp. IBSBa]|uniref:hypothetical protein n=1 Tax=Halomicrobium sp. IBSBa TaxID=2778916 RepID=UPI001ABF5CDD|nr:hypothetical protein [Halomicrobium sp. IBSBa]MBO4247093.1 hypothetical protein [Halomicrobium sp. IBSBa]
MKEPRYAATSLIEKITSPARNIITNASIFVGSRRAFGTNVFQNDWDLLIVLDSARHDIIQELKSEYEFLNDIDSIWSVGSTSPEWMANTFCRTYEEVISKTAYITSNPHSKTVLENNLSERYQGHRKDMKKLRRYGDFDIVQFNGFEAYEPVWRQNSTNKKYTMYENYGNPRNVTDRAISLLRQQDLDRTVLHYMPPHTPFIINAIRENREPREYEKSPWKYIRKTGDRSSPFEAHKKMLRWVLDDVELLLNNVDAKRVVITADHGDSFGEFGTYGHPAGSPNPHVRRVPWITTTAEDSEMHTPEQSNKNVNGNNVDVESQLEALGYV